MKKIIMVLLLCGAAQVQALTVKNNSNTAIKVSVNGGSASRTDVGAARPGETAHIALSEGIPNHVSVNRVYDFSESTLNCNSSTTMTINGQEQQVYVECFGLCGWGRTSKDCLRGVVQEQLTERSVPENPGLRDRDNFTFAINANGVGVLEPAK